MQQDAADQALPPALVERPGVAAWLERELQALLLDDDVALVASHLLGTVRALSGGVPSAARRAPSGGRRPAGQQSTQPVPRQQVDYYIFKCTLYHIEHCSVSP